MRVLRLDADVAFNEVVRLFIERGTVALGAAAMADLARAGEETFTYVAEQAPGTAVTFGLDVRPYAGLLEVSFDGVAISPGSFNLTHDVDPDDDLLLDLPLLLAARSVDRFDVAMAPGEPVSIKLRRDRVYGPAPRVAPLPLSGAGPFVVQAGTAELLGYFGGLLAGGVAAAAVPAFARHGERLADLALAGEVTGALAVDAEGRIGGGILWQADATRSVVRFYGPYVLTLDGRAGLAVALVEALIAAVSRSTIRGLFSRHGTADLPGDYFEMLGTLETPEGEVRAVYRGLHEDHAAAIWSDPAIQGFLEERFEELALAREIRPVRMPAAGEAVISVGFDRARRAATFHPVLAGADAGAVVAAHVGLLAGERTLLAELDLGRSIDATFIAPLLAAGFVPRYVVPSAGVGDVLLMQHEGAGRVGA